MYVNKFTQNIKNAFFLALLKCIPLMRNFKTIHVDALAS